MKKEIQEQVEESVTLKKGGGIKVGSSALCNWMCVIPVFLIE
jgi:hypothetical protein